MTGPVSPNRRIPRVPPWGSAALWLARCTVAILLGLSAPLARTAEENVTLNFVGAEIEPVIKAVGQITGKNFLIDPRVKGTINITTPTPVPRSQVFEIFLAALRLQGFTAVESSGIVQILPEADAKLHSVPTQRDRGARTTDSNRIVTQVFALRHESAAMLVPVLRPLISPNNTVAAYANNNTLVVTDYADNVQRIGRIIESIDQPGTGDPQVVRLYNATAAEVAQTVLRLLYEQPGGSAQGAAPGDPGQRVSIVADTRTNSIIIRGENPSKIGRVRRLIAQLDQPHNNGVAGNLRVIHLRNADAIKVAEVLRGSLANASQNAGGVEGAAGSPAGGGAPPAGLQGGRSSAEGIGHGAVLADPATNSLIINAPEPEFNALRAVIERLDTKRVQVFVEALILEVSSDKAAEFGIQWLNLQNTVAGAGRGPMGGSVFGDSGTNIIASAQSPGTIGKGLTIGIVRGQINIPGIGTIANLGMLARALETNANANILSTPNLITMDNEEAKIVIGQNVPFITGQYVTPGATAATLVPFQTIERKDIGLTLRIRPTVSEGGAIKMKIFQEVSSVQDRTNTAGIITNKRSIESLVEVEDGLIIALGGLIEDRRDNGVEQVPLLGDIPVLGHLFRYENRRSVKTNLMVFLRPQILRDGPAVQRASYDRYNFLMGEQYRNQPRPHPLLPDYPVPTWPPVSPLPAPPGVPPAPSAPLSPSGEGRGSNVQRPA
ncbi:MAG: type II secretion system secretin GspD [Betaproteobacteria bacterium]|nr:type II secretion system secretin GspD [Betaproteobacteria bacterium]